jgi:hypothetical protein
VVLFAEIGIMEAAVLGPQQAVPVPESVPATANKTAAAPGSLNKPRCAAGSGRRKTLCDITNLSRRVPEEEEPEESACAEGGGAALLAKARSPIRPDGLLTTLACVSLTLLFCFFSPKSACLFQENADLLRLLEERK